jgi:hypothetical protein
VISSGKVELYDCFGMKPGVKEEAKEEAEF